MSMQVSVWISGFVTILLNALIYFVPCNSCSCARSYSCVINMGILHKDNNIHVRSILEGQEEEEGGREEGSICTAWVGGGIGQTSQTLTRVRSWVCAVDSRN